MVLVRDLLLLLASPQLVQRIPRHRLVILRPLLATGTLAFPLHLPVIVQRHLTTARHLRLTVRLHLITVLLLQLTVRPHLSTALLARNLVAALQLNSTLQLPPLRLQATVRPLQCTVPPVLWAATLRPRLISTGLQLLLGLLRTQLLLRNGHPLHRLTLRPPLVAAEPISAFAR